MIYFIKKLRGWEYIILLFHLLLQVEVQVKRLYCVGKAIPTLPINIEDAARSEVEIEKALQVLISFLAFHACLCVLCTLLQFHS